MRKKPKVEFGEPIVWPVLVDGRELATLTKLESDDPAIDGAGIVFEFGCLGEDDTPPALERLEGWTWTTKTAAREAIENALRPADV